MSTEFLGMLDIVDDYWEVVNPQQVFLRCMPKPYARARFANGTAYNPASYTKYKKEICYMLRKAKLKIVKGPVAFQLDFLLPDRRPKDIDNLVKAVMDAANEVLYEDDSQVVLLKASKRVVSKDDAGIMLTIGSAVDSSRGDA